MRAGQVSDFGLSRVLEGESCYTKTYGTVTHMPPELMLNGCMTKAADVYSFGVLLWELYTGQRPWAGLRHAKIVVKVTLEGKQLDFPFGTPQRFKVPSSPPQDLHDQTAHPKHTVGLAQCRTYMHRQCTGSSDEGQWGDAAKAACSAGSHEAATPLECILVP